MKIEDIDKDLIAFYMIDNKYGGFDDWTEDDFDISFSMIINSLLVPTVISKTFCKSFFPWGITEESYKEIKNSIK